MSVRPSAVRSLLLAPLLLVATAACAADPELQPDEVLRAELGLTDRDRVYRVSVSGGAREASEPVELSVRPDSFVEFVTTDWLIHEVHFELDSLAAEARAFLVDTDQVASPPLLQLDSRFVVDFEGAPPGRYPFRLEGNGASGRGVVVVEANP